MAGSSDEFWEPWKSWEAMSELFRKRTEAFDRGEFALANQYGELWRHLYDEEAKGELAKLEAETEGCAAKQAEGERRDLEERMKINHRKELEVNISRGMALILGLGAIEWAGSESGLSGATLAGGVYL